MSERAQDKVRAAVAELREREALVEFFSTDELRALVRMGRSACGHLAAYVEYDEYDGSGSCRICGAISF